jgi:hypothetical protein
MPEIKFCSCEHEYQDKKYGKNKRVHNKTTNGWRCTACGNEKKAI